MAKDFRKFLKENKKTVIGFVLMYSLLVVLIQYITQVSEQNQNISSFDLFTSLAFLGSVILLLCRMFFYYTIVSAYKKVNTQFFRACIDSLRVYIIYFLKTLLVFIPFTILVSILYVKQVPLETIDDYLSSYSFLLLSLVLMVIFQILYAIRTYKIMFIPHINCATHAIGSKQKVEISKKLIEFNHKTLLIFFCLYQFFVVSSSLLVGIVENVQTVLIISGVLAFAEIMWSIILSWQFIRINEKREGIEDSTILVV